MIWITKVALGKIRNLPPSPFPCLPIVGHLYLLRSPLYRALGKLSARHGPMVMLRLGARRVFLVSSPEAVEECLTTNDITFANRPRLLAGKHLGFDYTTINWSSHDDHWRSLRRLVTLELLSSYRVRTLSVIRAEEVHHLVKKVMYPRVVRDGTMEMKSMLFEVVLNLMMTMISGRRCDDHGDAVMTRRFMEIVQESFKVMGATNVSDYLPWWKSVGGKQLEKKMMALNEKWHVLMQDLIEEQRRNTVVKELEKKNLIEVLLMLQETEPENHSDEVIKGLLQVLISAGTYTSSVTMEWMLSLLLNNPETLTKAHAEIDKCVGEDRLVNESDISNLPYLRCIINETMRKYPAAPLIFHESGKDCMVGGYHIPSGTMLLMNVWAMQNDPKNWEDPKKFKPERFVGLEGSGNAYNYKLMPFGAGRRRCPGENLGMCMIGLTMATLIQCFEWERPSNEMIDMTEGIGLITPKSKPLVVKCRPRGTMAKLLSQM
ncbi:unnamed protein product [Lactuca saligna]|uniref:Cytochrome P450 n=1 Tax=Lactuca saligna TaxID=75948 RepID=A0AA35VDE8_LACSI|nr:unnamed protein product [Lactuca saligna]